MWLASVNLSHTRISSRLKCGVKCELTPPQSQREQNETGTRKRKPRGYWKDAANLEKEVREFLRLNGWDNLNQLPSEQQFISASFPRPDLLYPIRLHGGWQAVAAKLNLKPACVSQPRSLYVTFAVDLRRGRMMPHNYWKDFDNLAKELQSFIAEHLEAKDTMPTAGQLAAHHRSDLIRAIRKHGGFPKVAEQLGLKAHRRPNGYWNDKRRTLVELKTFIAAHRLPPDRAPTYRTMKRFGASTLAAAVGRLGGTAHFSRLLRRKTPMALPAKESHPNVSETP
jgi:hypothetical protein